MTEHVSAASRLPRNAGRALLLAGVGAGLWLLGSAHSTASAEELAPPVAPVVQQLLWPVADQVVTQVVTPVVDQVVAPVVAPAVDQVVVPVVQPVVEHVVTPVVVPVVDQVVTPVLTPVVDALTPAVDPLRHVSAPVGDATGSVLADRSLPGAALLSTPPVSRPEASGTGVPASVDVAPGRVTATRAADGQAVAASLPSPVLPAGPAPLPMPLGVPAGAPAASVSAGFSSGDQMPADLAAAARAVAVTAFSAAADDAREAAVSTTFDSSFSPD